MTLPDSIEAIRSRLASRKSFFGGSVSTREQYTAPSWKDSSSKKANHQIDAAGERRRSSTAREPTALSLPPHQRSARTENRSSNSDINSMAAQPSRATAKAAAKRTAAAASAVASALLQSTPVSTKNTNLVRNTTKIIETTSNEEETKKKKISGEDHATLVLKQPLQRRISAPHHHNKEARMQRHQQMTSLGVQTVQLIRVPTTKPPQHNTNHTNNTTSTSSPPPATTKTKSPLLSTAPQPAVETTIPKQRLKGTFYGSAQPPAALCPIRTVDDESASDLDSFIEENDDEDDNDDNDDDGAQSTEAAKAASGGWKSALRDVLGGYDATAFAHIDAQPAGRRMHTSFEEIAVEEVRAAKIARGVDRREAEREAAEKEAKRVVMAAAKRRLDDGKQFNTNLMIDDGDSSSSCSDEEDEADDEDDDGGFIVGSDGRHLGVRARHKRRKLTAFLASY